MLRLVERVVDGAQEREMRAAADAPEVVGVDGPGHDSGEVVVVGEAHLGPDGLLVVVAHPLGLLVHIRRLVMLFPYRRPRVVLFRVRQQRIVKSVARSLACISKKWPFSGEHQRGQGRRDSAIARCQPTNIHRPWCQRDIDQMLVLLARFIELIHLDTPSSRCLAATLRNAAAICSQG